MPSIADIQRKLKMFDAFARHADTTVSLKKKWQSLFKTELSETSAKSFITHYREMRSKHTRGKHGKKSRRASRRQRGGVGAPLDYVMTPGANVSVYGRFPVEVNTDPGSIKDLDVYFQNALTFGCGKEAGMWPQVPANMGSNQVGGRRHRRTLKGRKSRRSASKQRGGDIFDTVGNFISGQYTNITGSAPPTLDPISRPMFATVYPNAMQSAYATWTGATPNNYPAPSEPEKRTWDFQSHGTKQALSADMVANINKNLNNYITPKIYVPTGSR